MRSSHRSCAILACPLIACLTAPLASRAWAQGNTAIIIDHNCRDIARIPVEWIVKAKSELHVAYGHTSHGQQIIEGLKTLDAFMTGKGAAPGTYAVAFNGGAPPGALDLLDSPWRTILGWQEYGRDLGSATYDGNETLVDQDYKAWLYTTRKYLGWNCATGDGSHLQDFAEGTPSYDAVASRNCNVILWAWCGQAGYRNTDQHIEGYLADMTQLESDYPMVRFVYMTGHVDGTGLSGTLHQNNEIIRDYCRAHNKTLYDFADIESWDPDLEYYGDRLVDDSAVYDADGDGVLELTVEIDGYPSEPLDGDKSWAVEWQDAHSLDVDWYECYIRNYHAPHLSVNLKAYAAWWLAARLVGWPEPSTVIVEPARLRIQR